MTNTQAAPKRLVRWQLWINDSPVGSWTDYDDDATARRMTKKIARYAAKVWPNRTYSIGKQNLA